MHCATGDDTCPICGEYRIYVDHVVTTKDEWDALQAVVEAARNMHPAGGEQELIAALDALDDLEEV